ncbi:hypothetical protein H5399_05215 [Tessaracoccus sp. MC1627]|uniref:hypothetical protein n=1 Tax=Tessaracoccus sp. MC1627 TaxID=2760312 RepID=UPI0016026E89|nr:hypothetical protein [Tessaracoccus sp. MC1627]MBB1512004.1 hypothetical protein [Tessaracoccus sp. MC1627]
MSGYAAGTSVPVERSRAEIERTLARFGADEFAYGYDKARAVVQFTASQRRVRFILWLPDRAARRFTHTPTGKSRTPEQAAAQWEQGCREAWRALAEVIKAKLVAVDTGIVGFEEEFAAHIVLPDGSSVGDWLLPQIAHAYELHEMPPMLALDAPRAES